METVTIESGTYDLGWRHTLPPAARAGVDSFVAPEEYLRAFSSARLVQLDEFEISTESLDVASLLEDVADEQLDDADELEPLCDVLDAVLARSGLRLPTEDEFEAALGGALFAWGDVIPTGTPYEPGDFTLHREAAASGLLMPHDSYQVELVRSAFKMGDGGTAVCGVYPWPVAWLTLSPCARVPAELLDDLDLWLEDATVHPVRLG